MAGIGIDVSDGIPAFRTRQGRQLRIYCTARPGQGSPSAAGRWGDLLAPSRRPEREATVGGVVVPEIHLAHLERVVRKRRLAARPVADAEGGDDQ